ncbi:MAG: PLP-dependent aminotransferase family protein [Bacillota bacterium]|nr:PLP-dependent aminotransferase family protein [Bacillota bacterium]
MDKYFLNFVEEVPKYIQVAKHIKKLIDEGNIKDGEKLPPIRSLANALNVNNVTIVNAYKKLQTEGYATQKMGSGTYAKRKDIHKKFKRDYAETFKRINNSSALNNFIDFTGETACGDFFPIETFKIILNQVLDRDGAEALIYQESSGYEGLRKSISQYFWQGRLNKDDILVVSGAQQGIDIVSKAILNVNDNVVVEKPTYGGALSVFNWRRVNVFEVSMEDDGINIEELEKILKKNYIKCFYLMSYFQNPTGVSYSLEKKLRILELAEEYDFYIIEDDYLSELIYNPQIKYESFKSLDKNDRVIYIKSFSKIFLPGIRLGYLISPKEISEQIQNSKVNTDISTSSLMQRALDIYIHEGYWKNHIKELTQIYSERNAFMDKCIQEIIGSKVLYKNPGGGLNFYIKIADEVSINCIKLFYECRKNKVIITPGVMFHKNVENGMKYFRLGFSQIGNDKIKNGIEVINNILLRSN